MKIIPALMIVSALLAGCAHDSLLEPGFKAGTEQTAKYREALIGRWYGDMKTSDGGRHRWLIERNKDSSFIVHFLSGIEGASIDQTEYGSWGVSGNIYFTITSGYLHDKMPEPRDPTDPSLYDAYKILSLSDDTMTYQSVETKRVYTARRVDDSFQFPVD